MNRTMLFTALAPVLLCGCLIDKPVISPRYVDLEPSEIAVPPVENRTIHDLSSVTTAGLLQRLTIGSRGVNVPVTFRAALLEGIEKKGYLAREIPMPGDDIRGPLPAGREMGFDAVLFCDITSWREVAGVEGGDVEIGGKVEVIRVGDAAHGGGEVLYRGEYHYQAGSSRSGVTTSFALDDTVRRAGLDALYFLPKRTKRAGN